MLLQLQLLPLFNIHILISICFILFRHPRHRKYLIGICDEIHDLRFEKNCPVIILYSLGDNTFKVLMWLNIPSDSVGNEQRKDTIKVFIYICFIGVFYITNWCQRMCNIQRMVVALHYSKHSGQFDIQNTVYYHVFQILYMEVQP